MPSLPKKACSMLLALPLAAFAQKVVTPPTPETGAGPLLSPHAAYEEAMHPLDVTRRSITNWSEAEVQALGISIKQAAAACAARDPKNFAGDTLIDLARLCALGQSWPTVIQAASLYISSNGTAEKPMLIRAYAARLDASLHLKDEAAALADGKAMLANLPYDGLTAEVIHEAIEYMQFLYTDDALALAVAREPLLLNRLRERAAATTVPRPATDAVASIVGGSVADQAAVPAAPPVYVTAPVPAPHELYEDGLAFAALQQLNKHADEAAATIAALDAVLPQTLGNDEAIPIAVARRRYALLGKPLPAVPATVALSMPNTLPELPAPHAITALLLFPDWCTQCIRMGSQFPQSVFMVNKHEAYFYALLAETLPAPTDVKSGSKPRPRESLNETPSLVVPPSVLDEFVSNDFPYLIITDADGIVRVLQPAGEDALQPGGTLDSAIAHIGALWPVAMPARPVPGHQQARADFHAHLGG